MLWKAVASEIVRGPFLEASVVTEQSKRDQGIAEAPNKWRDASHVRLTPESGRVRCN